MQKSGIPLLIHGEVTDPAIDIFDREAVFIDRILLKTLANFPALKIVLEHITTRQSADLVISATFPNLAATITPQHLMLNRNALFDGGLRPHAYCLPVVKREEHRLAVRRAAVSGSPNVFLGTDSAPHVVGAKESGCGCAGLFNAPFALEAYAQVFDEEGALDRFEAFASENGAAFLRPPAQRGLGHARARRRGRSRDNRRRRSVRRGRQLRLAAGRLGPAEPALADDIAEEALDPVIAFARPRLEPGAVLHRDRPAPRRDQAFVGQLARRGIDRRALDPEQSGKRLLRQLEPVARAVLRRQQPARCALLDRCENCCTPPTA